MQLPLLPWLPQPPPTAAAQPCSGFGLHLFAGLTNPGQSVLAAPQFIGQVTAELAFSVALAFLGSEDLGPAHQGIALLLQLLLRPEHPIVADRLVCEGIGLNLRAIVSHMAEAHHPGLLAEAQDLNEQTLEDIEVEAPELTDAAVVRLLVGGGQPEDQVLVAGALDLAGGDDADAVGVEQQQSQPLRGRRCLHPGVKALLPTGILALGSNQDVRIVQLIHRVQQEIQVVITRGAVTR